MALTSSPKPVNSTMIPSEKTVACTTPSRRLPDCRFRKYDTVNGIIGKTQGVKIAATPPKKAVKRNRLNPWDSEVGVTGAGVLAAAAAAPEAGVLTSA